MMNKKWTRQLWHQLIILITALVSTTVHADFELGMKHYNDKNFEPAFKEFMVSAEYGDNDAQQNIGAMYYRGEHVAKDLISAYAWMALAAQRIDIKEKGIHLKVLGKLKEDEKIIAEEKYQKLYAQYSSQALEKRLVPEFTGNSINAQKHRILKAANLIYPKDMSHRNKSGYVDITYTIDKYGLTRDFYIVAADSKSFEEAAINGLRRFHFDPAKINGKPVDVNGVNQRFKFFMKNAKFDDDKIDMHVEKFKTAANSATGKDIDKLRYAYLLELLPSLVPEYKLEDNPNDWYARAATEGNSTASYFLGRNILYGNMCIQDNGRSMGWLLRAAKQGNSQAQYMLAIEAFSGVRFEKNEDKAFFWLERAASTSQIAAVRHAWILSTHPNTQRRNAAVALSQLSKVEGAYYDKQNYYQAYAAAYAEAGDFASAISWQKKAIRDAEEFGLPLDILQQRLNSYVNNAPWREEI